MKILVICQWFPPEYAPIGVMLQELSQDLSLNGHAVTIITGYPNHPSGHLFAGYRKRLYSVEWNGAVRIVRCYLYTSPKRTFFRRILNYVTFAVTSFVTALCLGRQDLLFVVSPPLSNGIIALLLKKIKGLRYVFNVQDIYPDAAISTGIIRSRTLIRALQKLEMQTYHRADAISVISEGFRKNLVGKGVLPQKIRVIRNWLDSGEIVPIDGDSPFARKYGLTDRFVVLYSGTIGMISGAEILLECAEKLAAFGDILFLFVGEGVVRDSIVKSAAERQLKNVLFLPLQPREILPEVLSVAAVSVVTLLRGKGSSSVPSKVLGYMAAARPVIASVDPDSDTAGLVGEAECGICVDAGDADALTAAIHELYRDHGRAEMLGRNGRAFLLAHCSRGDMTEEYERLFVSCFQGDLCSEK